MIWFRRHIHTVSRHLLMGIVGAWLFAGLSPCVVAAPVCAPVVPMADCSPHEHALSGTTDTAGCGQVTAACALPEPLPPTTPFSVDAFTPVAALLTVLPLEPAQARLPGSPEQARYTARIPIPPRNLRNAVLLI